MTAKNMELTIPDLPKSDLVEKSIELTDYYLVDERWSSHQSVFKAVLDLFQVEYPVEVLRLLSGFSAGAGFSGGICGALSGGLAVLGYVYGSENPMPEKQHRQFIDAIQSKELSPSQKARIVVDSFREQYMFNRLVNDFKDNFGSTDCRELIAPFYEDPVSRPRFGNCRRVVRGTGGLVMAVILDLEEGIKPGLGANIYSHLL